MKSVFRFILSMMVLGMFVSCEKDNVTTTTDTTKLWPAYQSGVNKFGFINKGGEMVIPALYESASSFSCGYAVVQLNGKAYYINTKGELQQSVSFDQMDDFYYGRALVRIGSNYGMINTSFDYAIQPVYADLGHISEEGVTYFRRSSSDKNYGLIDKNGKELTQMIFESAPEFKDGVAVVKQGTKMGAINKKGKYVILPTYDNLLNVGKGRVRFMESNRYGLLDTEGNQIISPMYTFIGSFWGDGLAPYSMTGDKYGYINVDGKEKLASIYDGAYPFHEGYAWVISNNHYMVIDKKGQMIYTLPDGWRPAIQMCHNGLFLIQGDNEYRYIKPDGTYVYGWSYERAKIQERNGQYLLE